jgi:hypothetical protein
MPGPVFVHAGLAKTGTTTLQQEVFSKAPAIAYLGKTLVPALLDAARRQLTRVPARRFDADAARAAFDAYRAGREGVAVFSDEDLSVWKFLDPAVMGARLAAVFPDCRLILVARRPRDWVASQYAFRLSTWRPDTFDGVNAWLDKHLDRLEVGSDVAEIRFAETFRRLRDAAGGPPCLVLPYELMAADITAFLAEVEAFMGLGGQLRALAPAARQAPRKVRLDARMANFHRALGLVERDPGRFAGLARALSAHAVVADRRRFDALAGGTAVADWRDWLVRIEPRIRRALAEGDGAVEQALDLFEDEAIRPDLLARIEAVERHETAALREGFAVDLSPWGYAG